MKTTKIVTAGGGFAGVSAAMYLDRHYQHRRLQNPRSTLYHNPR